MDKEKTIFELDWENIEQDDESGDFDMFRKPVPGGWLVSNVRNGNESITYVPDINYDWCPEIRMPERYGTWLDGMAKFWKRYLDGKMEAL
jgi:hypothetical protein